MIEVAGEVNTPQAQSRQGFHAGAQHTMTCRMGKHMSLELDARAHAKKGGGGGSHDEPLALGAGQAFSLSNFHYRLFFFTF